MCQVIFFVQVAEPTYYRIIFETTYISKVCTKIFKETKKNSVCFRCDDFRKPVFKTVKPKIQLSVRKSQFLQHFLLKLPFFAFERHLQNPRFRKISCCFLTNRKK